MGVIKTVHEISCSLPPTRLFKSIVLDSANLFPKIMPHFFKSIETIEGDGCVGSIQLVTFAEGSGIKPAKHKIEEVDKEKLVFKYSLIEGGVLGDDFESISYVYTFEAAEHGGCIVKVVETYHPKVEEHHSKLEEIIERGKEKIKEFFNSVEAHLHANPHEYI